MDPKDLTTYLGLAAVYLLGVNVLLGLLMGARYNPWKRWPHRRINLLKLHNWTAYVALGLSALHPIPLLFLDKPRFALADVLFPVSSPEQPTINTLGAIALYLLVFTVVTSIYRAEIGRQRWKPLHYLTYVVAALLIVHGALTDQHLDNSPVDVLDAEKAGIIAAGVVILVATIVRFRWTAKHPKFKPPRRSAQRPA
ncbi:MAG TPA: ferric reductase-like transmembrane domain-containing protein [Gemmatimonadaceae bacterium]|jgi:predicted ferric reductase|nr:ferric reductase-like transmembrane domain-containing protein [Gemmatimonadaceae bacterium]